MVLILLMLMLILGLAHLLRVAVDRIPTLLIVLRIRHPAGIASRTFVARVAIVPSLDQTRSAIAFKGDVGKRDSRMWLELWRESR